MIHKLKTEVFYSDTDAYGVVWHGSYLRWLEMGRVLYCREKTGYSMTELEELDIVLPVANINIKYKSPAKLNDEIEITTRIIESTRVTLTFYQTVKAGDKTCVEATVKVAAIHKDGALYKTLPSLLGSIIDR